MPKMTTMMTTITMRPRPRPMRPYSMNFVPIIWSKTFVRNFSASPSGIVPCWHHKKYRIVLLYSQYYEGLKIKHVGLHSGPAASASQLRLHGTPFPKIYMIAQSLCWVSRVCWRHTCFVPSFPIAERRALLSLHLYFVAQYKFFVIFIIITLPYNGL